MPMRFQDNLFYLFHAPDLDVTTEVQVAYISSSDNSESNTINSLLCKELDGNSENNSFTKERLKDPSIQLIMQYFSEGVLPTEPQVAAKVVAQATMYS